MKAQEDMLIFESHFGGLAWLLVTFEADCFTLVFHFINSAVLAHFLLKEKLRKMGILGCILCIVGSTVIVLHAPGEHSISSVEEIWELAIQPAFLLYTASAIAVVLVLVLYCEPRYGQTNIMIYIGVCSVIGSLTVSISISFSKLYVCIENSSGKDLKGRARSEYPSNNSMLPKVEWALIR
ncbi:hypothetical protein RJ639_026676 [Escallonia herrerae]|uniref:Probable magnesium transporter n=1 Tax=Escallonia herrerae TaxID=1293975 RepID=A0AA88X412_9ASTE|nr:hypothetical protein RJ639_026676 [Escallonia herrerae]